MRLTARKIVFGVLLLVCWITGELASTQRGAFATEGGSTRADQPVAQGMAEDKFTSLERKVAEARRDFEAKRDAWEISGFNRKNHSAMAEARNRLTEAELALESLEIEAARKGQEAEFNTLQSLEQSIRQLTKTIEARDTATNPQGVLGAAGLDPSGAIPKRRVHLLAYGTEDDGQGMEGIREGSIANRRFIVELFKSVCQTRLLLAQTAPQFNENTIVQEINRVNAQPEDAVICYISTHGVFGSDRTHRLSPSGTSVASIRRSEIFKSLQSKRASLTVLITDSCGTSPFRPISGGIEGREIPKWPLWHLIFKTKGEVNVNSAEEGKEALFYVWKDNFQNRHGGVFTREFVRSAVYANPPTPIDLLNGTVAWDKFFTSVGKKASQISLPVNGIPRKQPIPAKLDASGRQITPYR